MSREPELLTSAGRMPERSQHRVSEGRIRKRTSGDGAWAAPKRRQQSNSARVYFAAIDSFAAVAIASAVMPKCL